MKQIFGWIGIAAVAATLLGVPGPAAAKDDPAKYGERMIAAKQVFQELMTSSDRKVPQKLLDKAKCIVVIPDMMKGAVGFGARWGNGVISCRHGQNWTAPVFVSLKGGSWGLQIGAEKTDLVLFLMNEKGARSLVTKSKFTLGGNASVAAGPLGRSGEAATDLNLNAEIYSYAKSKGLFAGISLEGASLRPSANANQIYYGKPISPQSVLFANQAPSPLPTEAKEFLSVLPK